jgi:hypothetical protein
MFLLLYVTITAIFSKLDKCYVVAEIMFMPHLNITKLQRNHHKIHLLLYKTFYDSVKMGIGCGPYQLLVIPLLNFK